MHHKITHAMVGIVAGAFIVAAVIFGLVTTLMERNVEAAAITRQPVIPLIAHPVDEQMSDCAACHQVQPGGMPQSHNTYGANTCLTCHTAGTQAELATEEAIPPAEQPAEASESEPVSEAAPSAFEGGPSPVPHPVGGAYTSCTGCHATGGNQPMPENHASYTNDMCVSCHAAPSVEETGAGTPAEAGMPLVPHDIDGQFVNCDTCHALNMGRLAMPENHAGFTKQTCTNCHKPAE